MTGKLWRWKSIRKVKWQIHTRSKTDLEAWWYCVNGTFIAMFSSFFIIPVSVLVSVSFQHWLAVLAICHHDGHRPAHCLYGRAHCASMDLPAGRMSPVPWRHVIVCSAGKSIIQMLLRGHQVTVGGLQLFSFVNFWLKKFYTVTVSWERRDFVHLWVVLFHILKCSKSTYVPLIPTCQYLAGYTQSASAIGLSAATVP